MIPTSDTNMSFKPPFLMRTAMAQTILASQKFRKSGTHAMEQSAKDIIMDCRDGVRLQGAYSKAPDNRGLMILLHGWEGSQNSTYVMSHARFLFERGYSIFRLNYRDHGDTHHLNEELFHSARFEEVFDAVRGAIEMAEGMPAFIIGFSLGGNFALRIARQTIIEPVKGLAHIFSVSPVINPVTAAPIVDINPLIKRYFLKKWTTSLAKKQMIFPELYDFGDLKRFKTVIDLSDHFIPAYSPYNTANEYFEAYRIWPDDLSNCDVPLDIIMAEDDPVLPAADVLALTLSDKTCLHYLPHGGHNGFFSSLMGPTWYDQHVERVLGDIS